ncbi:MAG: hypothetical protein ABI782_09900 [Anaerolineaceae bacterium]
MDTAAGYLVQIGNRDGTYTPVAVFAAQSSADQCVEELRANEGANVQIAWGTVVLHVAIPARCSFEVAIVPLIPAGVAPTTRLVG